MNWTAQQQTALTRVSEWIRKPGKPFFYLAGYAGTGKTTLAKHLSQDVVGQVLFAAYTGKAAHVLRSKGCEGASTIHSLIYLPKGECRARLDELEDRLVLHESGTRRLDHSELQMLREAINLERERIAKPAFSLNEASDLKGASLLVLDESSMIDGRVGSDLLSFGVPILVLGDPAQLPPVRGEGFFTSHEPDFLLTDVQRQARDNPIIELATRVRSGKSLDAGQYGTSLVLDGRPAPEDVLAASQVLVGRNETRHRYNMRMRELLGRKELVEPGDKIVCLRNNHDIGILNGSIWWVEEVVGSEDSDVMLLTIFNEEGRIDVPAHRDSFMPGPTAGSWFDRQGAEEFCHAGALTVHKSQGSQWDDVMVIDESAVFRSSARNHLYTAITRASERVTVIRRP